ncbi:response regulator [Paenibacillus sp. HWE-109]|uniref:response regulator transcription factor n=1 Tax=Paenibacillus sp. HWE-109 TaxID=1306526 RepID=UPI001EDCC507|nr:response regulator [Paenibacillus sp. HWE-109]UKS27000.1 response regulator [Paenibacillus sp. HWE-109]
MSRILLVDDEIYAIEGLKYNLEWESLGFTEVLEAYNIDMAKKIITEHPIDIMICDIEMPSGNGLQLMEWVKQHYPSMVVVFLTCHSEFDYAKKAVQLGVFDYIVKPVNFSEFEEIIVKALEIRKKELGFVEIKETYERFYPLWEAKKPLLIERIWQDYLDERISNDPVKMEGELQEVGLTISDNFTILPILISVEKWQREFSSRDEEVLEYAIRNAAAELVVGQDNGLALQDHSGINVIFIYSDGSEPLPLEDWRLRCEAFIRACNEHFYCHVSCYIGNWATIQDLSRVYQDLIAMESNNISLSNQAFMYQRQFGRKGEKTMIEMVKTYIKENLTAEITREDIAGSVHLNPAYLSRFFKKETGETLTDFITFERMKMARDLLTGTDATISQIAVSLGYTHFSHFSKMFKRTYQMTPHELRKWKNEDTGVRGR